MPVDFHEKRDARPQPLTIFSAAELAERPIPERHWLIPGILVPGSITMLNGAGGVGKSLLMLQLQVAAALKQPWLGIDLPEVLPSFALYCEDDVEEIHRRLADVCKHYGCTFRDLADIVRFTCRVGENNELMTFGFRNDNKGTLTPLYHQLHAEVKEWGIRLAIIDTVADTFGGNENIRPQARSFVNAIRKLALIRNGGVIISAHPSRAGIGDGTGLSGSTAWEGSVRCRVYFTKPRSPDKDVDGEDEPTDERILKTMKANYSKAGEKIRCKWDKGVFITTERPTGKGYVERLDDDRKVLDAAEWLVKRGTHLGADPQTKAALAVLVRKVPSCKDVAWKDVVSVQERLIASGKLVMVEIGPQSKRRVCLRPAHVRYPGEADSGETVKEHPADQEGALL